MSDFKRKEKVLVETKRFEGYIGEGIILRAYKDNTKDVYDVRIDKQVPLIDFNGDFSDFKISNKTVLVKLTGSEIKKN